MEYISQAPRQGSEAQSLGNALGTGLGTGLSSLIDKKIQDLQQRQGIDSRKKTYAKAGLPEWLAELPEDKQDLFLKEFDILPPESKQQIVEGLNNIGIEQPEQQYQQQSPSYMQASPFMQTEPMEVEGRMFSPLVRKQPAETVSPMESKIPGLNSLVQAGEGFQKESGSEGNETQSFPRLGHGNEGQAGPFESSQQGAHEPSIVDQQGYRLKRKNTAKGESPLSREKHELNLKKFEAEENERTLQHQLRLAPFIEQEAKELKAQQDAGKIAKKMLNILNKNEKKWPGVIGGNIGNLAGKELESLILRDPDVREYMSLGTALVTAIANTRKGVPTNYKTKLEQYAKADISQPIETQRRLLEGVVENTDEAEERNKFLVSQKDKKGNYPHDLVSRVSQFGREQQQKHKIFKYDEEEVPEYVLNDPQYYPEYFPDKKIRDTTTGKILKSNGKEWLPVKE
jgi:hypothetical protein